MVNPPLARAKPQQSLRRSGEPAAGANDGVMVSGSPLVCLENIGPRERQKRFRFGIGTLAVSLAIAAALILSGAPVWWRLFLFFPFASAGTGFFQALEKT